jgi:hypothetical protein
VKGASENQMTRLQSMIMNTAAGDNFEKLDESYEGQQIELS